MSNFKIVADDKSLVRDSYSKAILNTNYIELEKHRQKRRTMKEMHSKISKVETLEKDINELKTSVSYITTLLEKLTQKN